MDPLGVRGGVAGRIEARGTRQGIDLEAGVVGQRPLPGQLGHPAGLQASVFEVRRAGFFNLEAIRLLTNLQVDRIQHRADLGHLVGVATGNHQNRLGRARSHPKTPGAAIVPPKGVRQVGLNIPPQTNPGAPASIEP